MVQRDILRHTMEGTEVTGRALLVSRAVLIGHLSITVPIAIAIPLIVYWGLNEFGPDLWPYYVSGGFALAWQWYSTALPRWKASLSTRGVQESEIEQIAQHTGLVWPGAASIGRFAFHTTGAAVCGIHFGPWLLSRWFVWILPVAGLSTTTYSGDFWLQHLEVVSIVPALAVGYLASRYFPKFGTWAWTLPTIILCYKLLTFINPNVSVFGSNSWSRFSYYFVIEKSMPGFYDLRGSDPARVAAQLTLVAPFYSGVSYSVGALVEQRKVMEAFLRSVLREPEPEVFASEEAGIEWINDTSEGVNEPE